MENDGIEPGKGGTWNEGTGPVISGEMGSV